MSLPDSSGPGSAWASRRLLIAAAAAVLLAAGAAAALTATHSGARHPSAPAAHLAASTCSGPTGAAYVADAGWDGFTAINTANCDIAQTYNVGDTFVPGDPGDQNYSSTDEAVALSGSTLYFADTGNDSVGVIDAATLDPSNYNPAETLIHVGFDPEDLAVTPDGSQLWVTDTGPQTNPFSPSGISIISTATNTVTARIRLPAAPAQIAFSPSGATAYVTTTAGLAIFDTATHQLTGFVQGLGDPHGVVVSPDGSTVYVTSTYRNEVEIINASSDTVTGTVAVGQMPWQLVISGNGSTIYVADSDSDQISVINTGTDQEAARSRWPAGPTRWL